MRPSTLAWIGAGLVGTVLIGALISNHAGSAGLRAEIKALERRVEEVRKLEQDRDQLKAAQPDAQMLAAQRADRAALERLRSELRSLQSEVARPAQSPASEPSVIPSTHWTNAGHATPAATLETALWSGRNGNIELLASLLTFEEPAKSQAKVLFERLPTEIQLHYRSAEHLVALLTARDITYESMQIIATTPLNGTPSQQAQAAPTGAGETVVIQAKVQRPGQSPSTRKLVLRQMSDGWRLVVPAITIENYVAQFAPSKS